VFHGVLERGLVRFGGVSKAAEFADELNGRRPNLVVGGRGRKVMKRFDVAAHARFLANTPERSFLVRKEALDGTLA
jgi:hypothetical protein